MALPAYALVTLPEARSFLQAEDGDDPKDELLEIIITGLSKRIVQRTDDVYINPIDKDGYGLRTYDFNPLADSEVSIDYAREIDAVEVTASPQDDTSWRALESAEYYAEPVGDPVARSIRFLVGFDLPAQGVGWDALAFHRRGTDTMPSDWPSRDRAVTEARATLRVKAKWGLGADSTTVPANVKLALLMWLQNIHKRDIAFVSETIGVASATLRMPPDVLELLEGETDEQPTIGAV